MSHTVLTIDDRDDIRLLIRMTLNFNGFEVLEAGGGEQGLAMARSHKPDLILLDVMMPGISGLTVARTLAADPVLNHIPVIMLSAVGTPAAVEDGLATGVRAYLVKPFSPKGLLELVNRLTAPQTSVA